MPTIVGAARKLAGKFFDKGGAVLNPMHPDYGALCDYSTNDRTSILAALVDALYRLFIPSDTKVGTTRVPNEKGIQFEGPGLLSYSPSATLGNRVQNPAGRERPAWGAEYLYKFLVKVQAGTASTIRMSGDSTTAAGYSDALIALLATFPTITATKFGFTGEHTGQWLSTRLAGDIAAAPDVLIWHWGMNDCSGLSRTLVQFEADLRAGLTSYRASVPIAAGGIVLMTPNASSDGTNGRDEVHFEKMRQIIRNVAEDFQCAYFDTYTAFQDAYVGIGTWVDDPYADGLRGVHPQTAFSYAIAGELIDLLIPQGIRRSVGDSGFSNAAGAAVRLPTDALSTYPAGESIRRAQISDGWPMDGWVITTRENSVSTSGIQTNYKYNGDASPWIRTWNNTGVWGTWAAIGVDNVKTTTAPAASAGSSTYPPGISIRRATVANSWPLEGYVITSLVDTSGSSYAIQINHAFNSDQIPQVRQWTNAAAWGVWRAMGGSAIAPTNRYVGNGSASATAHTIAAGIQYTYILNNTAASAYTLTLPVAQDGALLTIVFANATGAITYTVTAPATTTVGLTTPAVAKVPISMVYHAATTTWYPA